VKYWRTSPIRATTTLGFAWAMVQIVTESPTANESERLLRFMVLLLRVRFGDNFGLRVSNFDASASGSLVAVFQDSVDRCLRAAAAEKAAGGRGLRFSVPTGVRSRVVRESTRSARAVIQSARCPT
jgi:hypothetical protein